MYENGARLFLALLNLLLLFQKNTVFHILPYYGGIQYFMYFPVFAWRTANFHHFLQSSELIDNLGRRLHQRRKYNLDGILGNMDVVAW